MAGTSIKVLADRFKDQPNGEAIMPVLFVGHGAPLYTLEENKYSLAWQAIAKKMPRPKAIVCISAHWLTRGTYVTAMPKPKTIHDFGGMDDRLYDIQYSAPGAPALATDIAKQLQDIHIGLDHEWGFDHGCWCVARWMYPKADIPMIQMSIDYPRGGAYLYDLAQQLAYLREKGVLVLCSGNIVHNLRRIRWDEPYAFDWAIEFDETSKQLIEKGDHASLIHYQKLGTAAELSIPTPDHYYPLLFALALQREKDQVQFPVDGIAYGSTSMRSVLLELEA